MENPLLPPPNSNTRDLWGGGGGEKTKMQSTFILSISPFHAWFTFYTKPKSMLEGCM